MLHTFFLKNLIHPTTGYKKGHISVIRIKSLQPDDKCQCGESRRTDRRTWVNWLVCWWWLSNINEKALHLCICQFGKFFVESGTTVRETVPRRYSLFPRQRLSSGFKTFCPLQKILASNYTKDCWEQPPTKCAEFGFSRECQMPLLLHLHLHLPLPLSLITMPQFHVL